MVTDRLAAAQLAAMLQLRPGKISFILPAQLSLQTGSVVIRRSLTNSEPLSVEIETVVPGLLSGNLDGTGAVFGDAVRVDADGKDSYHDVFSFMV